MKILSLFDWIACGYEALVRAGIKVDAYYASEIDKYAIQIATKNHPDIIEIWDVCNVDGKDYKWIDLLIWGSPCQWFSVAGKMLNFDDPRSKLFFEFVRILRESKPRYFLLENVKMKKEWQDIISSALWVQPIEINSSLVSAQNRRRLYRTNIPNVSQPKDKWIILKDILQENVDEKYYYSAERWNRMLSNKYEITKRLENPDSKCNTLLTNSWDNHERKIAEDLVFTRGGEVLVRQATKQWYIVANDGDGISLAYPNSTTRRGRVIHQKSNTLTTEWESHVLKDKRIRKLTPIEYERLQTMTDNYTAYLFKYIPIKSIKSLLSNQKVKWLNVVLNDAKENQNGNECALCIREDLTNTEAQNYQLNHPIGMQNVNIVIEKLEKNDEVQDECVIDITKTDLDIEMLSTLIKSRQKDEDEKLTDIIEIVVEDTNILGLWKITFEGNWMSENLSIILTLLKRIIQLKIFTYVKIGLNTTISIGSWRRLQQNYIESELLLSKMASIELNSDAQRYKMLWNWWTVDVVAHIFSFMECNSR